MMDTYCPLPFNHLYVAESGEVRPCCISRSFTSKPNVNTNTVDEIYNSPEFIQLREDLLSNKKPTICSSCWNLEASGVESLRERSVKNFGVPSIALYSDLKFEYLDLRFSNICNLKCIMCTPHNSHLLNDGKIIKLKEGFLDELVPLLSNLKEVYFAGGEPLIMEEHYKLLEYIIDNNLNVAVKYNTNLQILEQGKYKVLDLWSKLNIPPFVSVSCDGLYEFGEKIRINFNTDKFLKNIYKLKQSGVDYMISYTVGSYNIFNIPAFIDQVQKLNLVSSLEQVHFSNIVMYPKKFNIKNLNLNEKKEAEKTLIPINSHKKQMESIINFMYDKND